MLAYLVWQGLGTTAVGMLLALLVWWDATSGVVQNAWRVALPVAVTAVVNLAWMALWVVLHAQGLVVRSDGFLVSWLVLQLGVLAIVPCLWRDLLVAVSHKPIRFTFIFSVLALLNSFLLTEVLVGMYNRSSDGTRIVIRLLVLPLMVETLSAAMRFAARLLMHGDVPGATRGFILLPVATANALIGRFFSTGLNSAALSYALSFAVAALEVTIRYTAPMRDEWITRGARYAKTTVCASCCKPARKQARAVSGRTATEHVDWDDLSPATQHARTTRAHYAFITLDTVSEDIGMLTLIPVAIFFRLPTRIGGQPLPLGDVLLRVGFQWLLELWTDVGPFVVYAACRTWLIWRGDTLYTGLTQGVMEQVVATQAEAEAVTDPSDPPKSKDAKDISISVASAPSVSIDDAVEHSLPHTVCDPQASPVPLLPLAGSDSDDALGRWSHSKHPVGVNAALLRPMCGVFSDSSLWQSCRAAVPCTVQPHLASAIQQVKDARAPLLADDADVLWQRLPWRAVRRAMAPDVSGGDWSWLHWFTFQNELLAARMSASWQRRQRGWSVWVLVMSFFLLGFVIRTNLGTQQMCPFTDAEGAWFWDACSDSPTE